MVLTPADSSEGFCLLSTADSNEVLWLLSTADGNEVASNGTIELKTTS